MSNHIHNLIQSHIEDIEDYSEDLVEDIPFIILRVKEETQSELEEERIENDQLLDMEENCIINLNILDLSKKAKKYKIHSTELKRQCVEKVKLKKLSFFFKIGQIN